MDTVIAPGPVSAARSLQPGVQALQCSSDSRWAVLLGSQAAQLFDLEQLAHHGHISCCQARIGPACTHLLHT